MIVQQDRSPDSVQNIYLRNCNLMLEHALGKGLKIPASITQVIDNFNKQTAQIVTSSGSEAAEAVISGADVQAVGLEPLVKAHDRLSLLIAPVTPRALLFLVEEKNRETTWSLISPIKFIRQMVLAATCCLLAFILLGMLEWVSFSSGEEVFDSFGLPLLSNLLFYMAAAGLGASFAALFSSNEYIEAGTFDPKYKSSYWIRFLLGLVSGMLLAALIPLEGTGKIEVIGKPTLAMIGGFSASLVYRVLNRLVESVEMLFGRETKRTTAAEQEAVSVKKELAARTERHLRQLSELSKVIHDNDAPELIKQKIDDIFDDALPPYGEQPTAGHLTDDDNEYSENEEKHRAKEYDFGNADNPGVG